MGGDIQLDLAALRVLKGRVATALTTFRDAERMSDDLADLTGEHRLAGRVRDFADNWDHNRGRLEEQLVAVRDRHDAIDETMSDLDRSMAVAVEDGTTP